MSCCCCRQLPATSLEHASFGHMQSVLLEAMRLRPPAYLIGRCAKEDVEIGGVLVPAGRTVLPSPYLLHRDPRHWDQPLSFNPGRWTDALEQSGGSSVRLCSGMGPGGAYVPFGAGPRNCIGAGFALLEGAVVLAEIARGFVVAPGGRFAR